MKRCRYIVLLLLVGLVGQGCSSRAIHEAEAVVAQADSLWQAGLMYGIDAGDSLTLAQAYETLGAYQFLSPFTFHPSSSFTHACYHYGKLLRAKDHPAEAMQCFINATHTRTPDNHILGRVYSNMGDLCHLAGDFQLSYDMFEKSANCFLADNDSLSYYFLLNDMAFELAAQKDTSYICVLLDSIQTYNHSDVILKSQETKALMYLQSQHYQAAISLIDSMQVEGYYDLMGYLLKAQAYEHINQFDSAVSNASFILSHTTDSRYLISACYILSHDDKSISSDSILTLTSIRADAQKEWGVRNGEYANAVQLLEKDLDRKPDWRWLYAVIATVLIIGSCILLYVHKRRSQHKLLSQQVDDLSKINDSVKELHEHIKKEYTEYKDNLLTQMEQNYAVLTQSPNLFQDIHWKEFNALCQIINDNFGMLAAKLQGIYHLSEKEIRLCILVLLEITNSKQMAEMLYYSESGIRNFKNRTAKKLGTNSIEMRNALLKLAISEYPNAANNEIVHA